MNDCLITGGAGFIGANLAIRLIQQGKKITILDNLSRPGVEKNLSWLKQNFEGRFDFIKADVRDFENIKTHVRKNDTVFHFASQTAVTTSVHDPRTDFEINALGAVNVLEAARLSANPPAILFTSTNKVYGQLASLEVVETDTQYRFKSLPQGVSESQNLDFYSPYGCSKGAADQYMLDYSRIYGLKTVVFRMSCIYGPHQFGTEDQGWVIHFLISALLERKINIFGNGKQVRDILYVDDLANAFSLAAENLDKTAGGVFNIGGGPQNSISLLQLLELLERITDRRISTEFFDWRPGDQKIYVSNIARAKNTFGWAPEVSSEEGIKRLYQWVKDNRPLFSG